MFLKLFEASRLRRATRRRLEHLKNPTDAASENELLKLLRRWRNEAGQLGHVIKRVVVAYETSRWCWLARRLPTHKIKPDRFEFTRSQLERQLIDCLRGLGDIRPNQLVENLSDLVVVELDAKRSGNGFGVLRRGKRVEDFCLSVRRNLTVAGEGRTWLAVRTPTK